VAKKPEDHPFENNPFTEELFDWMGSPGGQLSIEVSDTLWYLMADVRLDVRQREFLWPDAQHLGFDQCVERIHNEHPQFPRERIASFMVSWLEHYAPEDESEEELDELDQLAEDWIRELERRLQSP
jgi:hypothetical protein